MFLLRSMRFFATSAAHELRDLSKFGFSSCCAPQPARRILRISRPTSLNMKLLASTNKQQLNSNIVQLLDLLRILRANTASKTPTVSVLLSKSSHNLRSERVKGQPLKVSLMKMKLSNFNDEKKKALAKILSNLSPNSNLEDLTKAIKTLPGVEAERESFHEAVNMKQAFWKAGTEVKFLS